jgi:hypothetical protein
VHLSIRVTGAAPSPCCVGRALLTRYHSKENDSPLLARYQEKGHCLSILHGLCWGPSAFEGPQKHDLTVFLEYNV